MAYDISVVIPYWKKLYEIRLVLEALSLQNYPGDKFEVVIINDGCDDGVEDIVKSYGSRININYHYIDHTGNRGRNRNLGAKFASAPRLIFIDSDMIPDKNMIRCFESATRNDKKLVSLGTRYTLMDIDKRFIDAKTISENFEILEGLPAWNDDRTNSINHTKRTGIKWKGNWQHLYSHSFCMWKDTFESVNGFDEEFSRNWGAEDVELGYRLFRKSGCRIELNFDVRSYHVHHGVDFFSQTASLKKNYEIFRNKYEDWEVELFTREFECWSVQAMNIQDAILAKKHLVTRLENVEDLVDSLPERTVMVGIDHPSLIKSINVVSVFNPEGDRSDRKIQNIFGFCKNFGDDTYELAILSGEFESINRGLQIYIENAFSKFAKKILILKNGQKCVRLAEAETSKRHIRKRKMLNFTIMNDFNRNMTRYNFLNLAVACSKVGFEVGIELAYDPAKEVHVNDGYLRFENPEKCRTIQKLIEPEYNFSGDLIPTFMESGCATTSNRAIGFRMFWENMVYYNEDKYYENLMIGSYSRYFYKRLREKELFPGNTFPRHFLPDGIDIEKIERIEKTVDRSKRPFTFIWSEQFTMPNDNLELVLRSFTESFAGNKDVILKVLLPENMKPFYRSEYYGNTFSVMTENYSSNIKIMADRVKENMIEKYGKETNIVFIDTAHTDERQTYEVANSDCYIGMGSTRGIHPLALESVAMGKRPIITDDNRYEGYFTDRQSMTVKTEKISALYDFGRIETPKFEEADRSRYYLMSRPLMDSLSSVMKDAYANRASLRLDEDFVRNFRKDFDWRNIAQTLKSILYS